MRYPTIKEEISKVLYLDRQLTRKDILRRIDRRIHEHIDRKADARLIQVLTDLKNEIRELDERAGD